jgi:hypothetical protein
MRNQVHRRSAALAASLFVLLASPVEAQVLYGSIVGTVNDPTGAVVPGATITISDKSTGQSRETTTNEAGQYSLSNVIAGTYELKVAKAGFRLYTATNVAATINNVARVDVRLDVGTANEQITVAANGSLLQTDKADLHVEINTKEVTDLPAGQLPQLPKPDQSGTGSHARRSTEQPAWRSCPGALDEHQWYEPEQQHHQGGRRGEPVPVAAASYRLRRARGNGGYREHRHE